MALAKFSLAVAVLFAPINVQACTLIDVNSDIIGNIRFAVLSEKHITTSGRPTFYSEVSELYLYHEDQGDRMGRWVIGNDILSPNALSYVESWGVHPTLLHAAHDTWNVKWFSAKNGIWDLDTSMRITCAAQLTDSYFGENTFYFDGASLLPHLSGFYVEILKSNESFSRGPMFSLVSHSLNEQIFMHASIGDSGIRTWIIGTEIGVDRGLAYINDDAKTPNKISSNNWAYSVDNEWVNGEGFIIQGDLDHNVYFNLRAHRALKYVPQGQDFFLLRNLIPIPAVGFGTGALKDPKNSIPRAIETGYRFLDLARGYGNENFVGDMFMKELKNNNFPRREEIFILSKVWPTDLGFAPTAAAIAQSLTELRTNYIDAYLIHWPECFPDVEWMNCHEIVDPSGTWRDSWRAMEKAYAEGSLMSIGVSNFNIDLLKELEEFAAVKPHLVQNFADPDNLDLEVRRYCWENEILYIPYAFQRNRERLSMGKKNILQEIAATHGKTENSVILRSFYQSNAAVIPRSDNTQHMDENLNIMGWEISNADMIRLGWPQEPSSEDEL